MSDSNTQRATYIAAIQRSQRHGSGSPPATVSYHLIAGERLTCLISNAHRLLKARYRKSPLWSLVSDLTGHGSQISAEICRESGYDPHQLCGAKYLKAAAPNKP